MWHVWLHVHDPSRALYIYNFQVPEDAEYGASNETSAIDFVLEKYVSVGHGQRFIDNGWRVVRAQACHAQFVLTFDIDPIDQPEYKRGRSHQ